MIRLYLPPCGTCSQNPGATVESFAVETRDGNLYVVTCPRGHVATVRLQHRPFEVLFEMGSIAILDGYYREAVANFTATLERFYEFYLEMVALKFGVASDSFLKTWKAVANQSERQLGAYLFAYLFETSSVPAHLSNDAIKFRNRVIHKGYIPDRGETIDYGAKAFDLMWPVMERLKNDHEDLLYKQFVRWALPIEQRVQLTYGIAFETILAIAYVRPSGYYENGYKKIVEAYPETLRFRRERQLPGFSNL